MTRDAVFEQMLEALERVEMENLENLSRIAEQEILIRDLRGENETLKEEIR